MAHVVLCDQMNFDSSSTHLPFGCSMMFFLDACEDDAIGSFNGSGGLRVVLWQNRPTKQD